MQSATKDAFRGTFAPATWMSRELQLLRHGWCCSSGSLGGLSNSCAGRPCPKFLQLHKYQIVRSTHKQLPDMALCINTLQLPEHALRVVALQQGMRHAEAYTGVEEGKQDWWVPRIKLFACDTANTMLQAVCTTHDTASTSFSCLCNSWASNPQRKQTQVCASCAAALTFS